MEHNGETITLKLYKEGMVVFINHDIPFDVIKTTVTEKFKSSQNFFKGLTLKVGFIGVSLEKTQMQELIDGISAVIECNAVLWENPQPVEYMKKDETTEEPSLTPEQLISNAFKIEIEDEYTKFYTKTIRSGQLLESDGNIVVIGDVNPGAELIAAGNIIIMGSVKGIVHAGVKGNREAIVVALNLSPIQLRIADVISRSPDDDENHGFVPEIAYIKNDEIFIEDFLQKRK